MSLNRSKPLKRTPMKRKKTERCWVAAKAKKERAIEAGEGCKVCGSLANLQSYHTVGRRYDPVVIGPKGGKVRMVPAEAVVIMCPEHHLLYDAYSLSILDLVTEDEWNYATSTLGEERARHRLSGGNA